MLIHPDRLFPAEPRTRKIARTLYEQVRGLPIISPHGHTKAGWFARNEPFPDPANSSSSPITTSSACSTARASRSTTSDIGQPVIKDPRKVWRIFASHYYLFRGTPTRLWLDYSFQELFGFERASLRENRRPLLRHHRRKAEDSRVPAPRSLSSGSILKSSPPPIRPLDSLADHKAIRDSGWKARILPAFRPDPVVDPEFAGFAGNHCQMGEQTGEDTVHLDRLPERAAQGPRPLPRDGLHFHRSRPSHRANRRPSRR